MRKFTDSLSEKLKNPEFAIEYINAASEDEDPQLFLLALNDFVKANEGFSDTAKKLGVNRENLHRTLGKSGNPRYHNLVSVLDGLGLKLKVEYCRSH